MPAGPDTVKAFQVEHAALLAAVTEIVGAEWRALPGYDEADVATWLARVVPIVQAGQSNMTALVDGYYADLLDEQPFGLLVRNPRGVGLDEVYRRPFVETWTKMKNGADFADAVDAARQRAEVLAGSDMQLAMRDAASQVKSERIVGYRRVLDGNACMFCATASTQRYRRADLLPLHPRCGCTVQPIIGERDPGQVVNKELLSELKGRGPQYWKQRGYVDNAGKPIDPTSLTSSKADVAVREHGELGPTLVSKHDVFTGPADV